MKPRREGLLPVIGIVSMLTQVVFIQQFVLHRRELRRKLALFCNVREDHVLENLDADYLYRVPLML